MFGWKFEIYGKCLSMLSMSELKIFSLTYISLLISMLSLYLRIYVFLYFFFSLSPLQSLRKILAQVLNAYILEGFWYKEWVI